MIIFLVVVTSIVSSAFSVFLTLFIIGMVRRSRTKKREPNPEEIEAFVIPNAQVSYHEGVVVIIPHEDDDGDTIIAATSKDLN